MAWWFKRVRTIVNVNDSPVWNVCDGERIIHKTKRLFILLKEKIIFIVRCELMKKLWNKKVKWGWYIVTFESAWSSPKLKLNYPPPPRPLTGHRITSSPFLPFTLTSLLGACAWRNYETKRSNNMPASVHLIQTLCLSLYSNASVQFILLPSFNRNAKLRFFRKWYYPSCRK